MSSTAKDRIIKITKEQPDDSSYDEILRELIFYRMIDQGVKDSKNARTISHKDLLNEINSWSK